MAKRPVGRMKKDRYEGTPRTMTQVQSTNLVLRPVIKTSAVGNSQTAQMHAERLQDPGDLFGNRG